MPEPLLPDDVRSLYEELMAEGSRAVTLDTSAFAEPTLRALLDMGLATALELEPPLLLPTSPDAVFARLLVRWQRIMEARRDRYAQIQSIAIELQRTAVQAAAHLSSSRSCNLVRSRDHAVAIFGALTGSADHKVRSCVTGPYGSARTLPSGEQHPAVPQYVAPPRDFLADGGRKYILCDRAHANDLPHHLASGYADGEEIRVVEEKLPMKLLIVDDHTALVPLGPYGYPCALLRDQRLVSMFGKFFDLKWAQAAPWVPSGTATTTKDDTQRQRILDALAAGLKDEAIARQLGVSVRTVRRHITALMQQLGASTRFAAGVAAVRRGWVTRPA